MHEIVFELLLTRLAAIRERQTFRTESQNERTRAGQIHWKLISFTARILIKQSASVISVIIKVHHWYQLGKFVDKYMVQPYEKNGEGTNHIFWSLIESEIFSIFSFISPEEGIFIFNS